MVNIFCSQLMRISAVTRSRINRNVTKKLIWRIQSKANRDPNWIYFSTFMCKSVNEESYLINFAGVIAIKFVASSNVIFTFCSTELTSSHDIEQMNSSCDNSANMSTSAGRPLQLSRVHVVIHLWNNKATAKSRSICGKINFASFPNKKRSQLLKQTSPLVLETLAGKIFTFPKTRAEKDFWHCSTAASWKTRDDSRSCHKY